MNRITAWAASAALVVSPLALATPTYAAPAKADAYTVSAKINKTVAIGKETTLKVRGRVTPKAARQKVVLQQRVGNKKKWKATGTAKIKKNGTYVLKDVPSTPGHPPVPRGQAGLRRCPQGCQQGTGRQGLPRGRSSPRASRCPPTW